MGMVTSAQDGGSSLVFSSGFQLIKPVVRLFAPTHLDFLSFIMEGVLTDPFFCTHRDAGPRIC